MIGGRNGWIAWPVGLLCVGVVAGLVWMARPAVPAVIGFIGDTLRAGTAAHGPSAVDTATPGVRAAPEALPGSGTPGASGVPGVSATDLPDGLTGDCRSLYPTDLWTALTLRRDVVLSQSMDPPAGVSAAVRAALAPQVVMTCSWHENGAGGGTVTTTLSRVAAGPAGEATSVVSARRALAAQGLTCTTLGTGIRCAGAVAVAGAADGTTEDDVVRGGLWLSTTETAWHPDGYTDALIARLWP